MKKFLKLIFFSCLLLIVFNGNGQSCQQPVIRTQPLTQTGCQGAPITFFINATGTGLTYQWRKNGVPIPGANNSNYTITSVNYTDLAYYDVKITGDCGSVTSNVAFLFVRLASLMTLQPQSQATCVGGSITFYVDAIGFVIRYQWRKNGINIPGATTSVYSISNVTPADEAVYDVIITGTCGNLQSAPATLSISAKGTWMGTYSTDWNDSRNWCIGIPDALTNVTISPGAPHMPLVTPGNNSVKDIHIAAGASLTISPSNKLNIYGSLSNEGQFDASAGDLVFKGNSIQTVAAFSCVNAIIDGDGGVNLAGDALISGLLDLKKGNILLGSSNLSLMNGCTGSLASHIITNGSGMVKILQLAANNARLVPVSPDDQSYNPVLIVANSGHIADDIKVNVSRGVYTQSLSAGAIPGPLTGSGAGFYFRDHVVDRVWNITETIAGGSNVNITVQWSEEQELPGFMRMNCGIMHFANGGWQEAVSPEAVLPGPFTLTAKNISSFAPLAIRTKPVARIYPNPAHNNLNIELNINSASPSVFSVYDLSGKLVLNKQVSLNAGLNQSSIDTRNLNTGIYFLVVTVNGQPNFLREKFVKAF